MNEDIYDFLNREVAYFLESGIWKIHSSQKSHAEEFFLIKNKNRLE